MRMKGEQNNAKARHFIAVIVVATLYLEHSLAVRSVWRQFTYFTVKESMV